MEFEMRKVKKDITNETLKVAFVWKFAWEVIIENGIISHIIRR